MQRGGWEGWGLGVGWLARMNPAQQAVARARTSTVPSQTSIEIANSHVSPTAISPLHARGPLCSPGASDMAQAERAAGDARIGREGGSNPAWARSRVRAGNLVTTRWTGFATTCVRQEARQKGSSQTTATTDRVDAQHLDLCCRRPMPCRIARDEWREARRLVPEDKAER